MLSGARWRGKPKAPPPPRPWLKPPFIGQHSVAASYTVAEILDLLCEGPIEGICNKNGNVTNTWFQGVYLNETPIATTDNDVLFQHDTDQRDLPVAKASWLTRSYQGRIPTFYESANIAVIEGAYPYRVTSNTPIAGEYLRKGTGAEWEWQFVYSQEALRVNFWPLAEFKIIIPAGSPKPHKFYAKFIVHSSITGTETKEYSETFNSSGTFTRNLRLPFRQIEKTNNPQKMTIKAYSHVSLDPIWDEEGLNIDWTETSNNLDVGRTETVIRTPMNEYTVFNRPYDKDTSHQIKYNFNNIYMEFREGRIDNNNFTSFRALTEDFDYDITLRGPFRVGGQIQLIT